MLRIGGKVLNPAMLGGESVSMEGRIGKMRQPRLLEAHGQESLQRALAWHRDLTQLNFFD